MRELVGATGSTLGGTGESLGRVHSFFRGFLTTPHEPQRFCSCVWVPAESAPRARLCSTHRARLNRHHGSSRRQAIFPPPRYGAKQSRGRSPHLSAASVSHSTSCQPCTRLDFQEPPHPVRRGATHVGSTCRRPARAACENCGGIGRGPRAVAAKCRRPAWGSFCGETVPIGTRFGPAPWQRVGVPEIAGNAALRSRHT